MAKESTHLQYCNLKTEVSIEDWQRLFLRSAELKQLLLHIVTLISEDRYISNQEQLRLEERLSQLSKSSPEDTHAIFILQLAIFNAILRPAINLVENAENHDQKIEHIRANHNQFKLYTLLSRGLSGFDLEEQKQRLVEILVKLHTPKQIRTVEEVGA